MSARPDTWMPMYWGDYARDTGHLNAAGHGAYLMLIKHYWCTGESLADDDDELWRVACCDSVKEWQKLRPKIVRLFVVDGGRLRHKRIEAELANALALTEQRRGAGKASAEARARKRGGGDDDDGDGSDDGDGNGRAPGEATEIERSFNARSTPVASPLPTGVQRDVNGRSISVDIPLQRNGRPSPSPSQRKEERDRSLRSLVPSETDSNELFEPGQALPREPADADFDAFWKEYPRKDDKGHARKAWAAARRKAASEAILAGLRRHQFAEDPKFRPLAATWLNGERWADATASPAPQRLPDVPPSFNPPDAWGVRAWVLRQPDVTMQRGSMPYDEYAINGEIVEDVAIGVLDAAGISPSARPNLDVLGAWIRDDCCPLAVLDQIRRQVAHMDGPARSLAAFDTVVRSYVDPIAREIAEMDAALARVGVSR